jgi:hypothetical protein
MARVPVKCSHASTVRGALPLQRSGSRFQKNYMGKRILAPHAGSWPLTRWVWGHCRYPKYQVSPHTSLKSRQGPGRESMHCHMSHGNGPQLPMKEGFVAATRPTVLDPASLRGRAPVLPRIL